MADHRMHASVGSIFAMLFAGHQVGDVWIQTDSQAQVKGKPGRDGQRACATHVATLTATQAAFVALACLATGDRLNVRRAAVGLAVNAVSHYAMDRRDHGVLPHLTRMLRRYGKDDFANHGEGLASGAAHLDQAWHIGWCAIAAAIITGKA